MARAAIRSEQKTELLNTGKHPMYLH